MGGLMAQVSSGELQTLVSTLQHSNKQTGEVARAIAALSTPLAAMGAGLSGVASAAAANNAAVLRVSAPNGSGGALAARTGGAGLSAPLPDAPEGYITVDIPGVGPRLIPYYPA
jgi:hypothetical protein